MVVTHHLTSYALVVVLLALALIYRVVRSPKPNPWPFAAFAGVLAVVWLLIAASDTVDYLDPVLAGAVKAIWTRSSANRRPRALFQAASPTRHETPFVGRLITLAAVGFLLLGFLAGFREVWARRGKRPFVWSSASAAPPSSRRWPCALRPQPGRPATAPAVPLHRPRLRRRLCRAAADPRGPQLLRRRCCSAASASSSSAARSPAGPGTAAGPADCGSRPTVRHSNRSRSRSPAWARRPPPRSAFAAG